MKRFILLLLLAAAVLSCFVITVSADETVISDEGRLPFEDVREGHWFTPYIKFCYANGIIKGMTEYTVVPNGTLTRAQFVTMLCNLEGVDTSSYTVDTFTDVKSSHWYYGAIAWAYSEGIVNGMNENTFAPNKTLTRAELSSVMYSYMKEQYEVEVSEDVLDKFSDKPKAEYWYYEPIRYVVSAGLISGMANGTLSATGTVTRAQAAVIFEAFMKNYFYASCEHSFTDTTCTEAAVCTKCGLANGLPDGHVLTAYDCVTGGICLICGVKAEPSSTIHNFVTATCSKPIRCTRCGETRGEALGHRWTAATCTAPSICSACGVKEGSAKGHSFKAASCTTPKTCTVCGVKEGYALGHNYSDNFCTRCGIDSPYTRVVYNVKQKGSYDKTTNCYTYHTNTTSGVIGVVYDASSGELAIFYGGYYNSGAYDITTLFLPKSGTTCRFEYLYTNSSNVAVFYGIGYINASIVDENLFLSFSQYEGGSQNLATACENAGYEIHLMLKDINNLLVGLGDVRIAEFGFKGYK